MGIELKSSSITVDEQVVRVVSDQRVVMGTAYKPDTHIEWVKEDAVNQYTKALLVQLFKGRVKDIRQTTEEVWVKGGKQPIKMAEHILEIGSIKYILTIRNCPQCVYKFKLNITSLKSGEIYLISRNNTCSAGVFPVAGRCKATSHKNKGRNNIQSSVYLK